MRVSSAAGKETLICLPCRLVMVPKPSEVSALLIQRWPIVNVIDRNFPITKWVKLGMVGVIK